MGRVAPGAMALLTLTWAKHICLKRAGSARFTRVPPPTNDLDFLYLNWH